MEWLMTYQWEILIVFEIISLISLLLFGVVRYILDKKRLGLFFLTLFIGLIGFEAVFGWFIYQKTGEVSNFQIIITIFVLYAITFGVSDFKKLDRWMRKVIGKWRGIQLLTEKDIEIMNKQKDPKHIARKYRISSFIHLFVFLVVQIVFWIYGTSGMQEMMFYLTDLTWIGTEDLAKTPYANETMYQISIVWGIVFIVDFIYSWSYTVFPSKSKQ